MNGQRAARKLFAPGSLRFDPETGALLSSDEEIARALSGGKLIPSFKREPPRQASGLPGTSGPLRVEAVRGVPHILGEGVSVPCDSRGEAELELARMQASASAEVPGQAAAVLATPAAQTVSAVQEPQEELVYEGSSPTAESRASLQKGAVRLEPYRLGTTTTTTPEADSLPLLSCAGGRT